ncbi:MAG: SRPBCC family protein [Gemmatimonadota bacterium]
MTRIAAEIHIDAPKELVWDILADLGGIQNYHPGVTASYYNPGDRRGVGASRHCDLKPFGSVEETAIEWHEGESYTLRLHDGKRVPPFKHAAARLAVQPNGPGSVVTMELDYGLRFGLAGRLMDRMAVRSQFSKVLPALLTGLKEHAESERQQAA